MKMLYVLSAVNLLSVSNSFCGGAVENKVNTLFHPDSSTEVLAAVEKSGLHEHIKTKLEALRADCTAEGASLYREKFALYDFCMNFCAQKYWGTVKPLLKEVFPTLAKTNPELARYTIDYDYDGSLIQRDVSDEQELKPLSTTLEFVSLPQRYIDASSL